MREIILTQGRVAIVDDEDYERVSKYKWYAMNSGLKRRRVERWYAEGSVNGTYTKLHRFIMGLAKSQKLNVDHINNDSLDCRKENLRLVTRQQNRFNSKTSKKGYKGVFDSHRKNKRWIALIRFNKKAIYLGHHKTQEEAALAYNSKALELFGEYVRLNTIKQ